MQMQTESDEIRKYLDDRKREAVKIDPQTAEVTWWYAETLDPYGICNLPPEAQQIGREYFARHPGSEIWVWFGDLPEGARLPVATPCWCGSGRTAWASAPGQPTPTRKVAQSPSRSRMAACYDLV